jgi:hypothetical protein
MIASATKITTRNNAIGLVKLLITSVFCMIALADCKDQENWKVVAIDENGKPVSGLKIFITYPSGANPPMFVTDKDGKATLNPKSKVGIHSVALSFDHHKLGIPWREIKWPLRVRIREKDIEIIKNEK